jgi:3D (Asp-Asp-Asp) domain-containing protein
MKELITWLLISVSTTATVYNAVPEQCGDNPTVTASGRQIQPEKVSELRIIAMERTMMARHNIHYGDTVLVKGAGAYDGEWVVEDTMHPRFAGQDKVDFLVPADVRLGKWSNVEVYKRQ